MKADTSLKLQIPATLDPRFRPAALVNHRYLRSARNPVPVVLGLERESGANSRYETVVNGVSDADSFRYIERVVKFLLWARGGWRIYFGGPMMLGEQIQRSYAVGDARAFDVELM